MKGLDAHITGGRYAEEELDCACKNGHRWLAPGYREYGAAYFCDEERGPVCPACKHFDVEGAGDDEVGEPLDGYVLIDGVYRILQDDEPVHPDDEPVHIGEILAVAALSGQSARHVLAVLDGHRAGEEPGSFVRALIEAIVRADGENKAKLRLGFPGLVAAVELYQTGPLDLLVSYAEGS
jgi:hypothetical protein